MDRPGSWKAVEDTFVAFQLLWSFRSSPGRKVRGRTNNRPSYLGCQPYCHHVGFYASADGGYWWLGTSDAFYGTGIGTTFAAGVPYTSFANFDVGLGFTYKVFTLDFRYTWSGLNKGDCNAFTSDHTASGPATFVTAINPGGIGSNWCAQTFLVKLSSDLTLANLK